MRGTPWTKQELRMWAGYLPVVETGMSRLTVETGWEGDDDEKLLNELIANAGRDPF